MEEKLTALESTIAFQDRKLEELSQVIYKQQIQLDTLCKDMEQIRSQFKNISEEAQDKRPPHY
jgi:uncharacterized coiled-coil protein SlyX